MTEKVEPEAQPAVTQPQATEEAPPAAADEQQQPKPELEKKEAVVAEAAKEKKPRTPRARKPRQPKAVTHPPYFQMIEEAILALNEKSGSSPYAIAKFMEENHKSVLPANFRKILTLQIKNSVSRGKLTKVRASYKLPEAGEKETTIRGKARVAKTRLTSKVEAEAKPKEAKPKPKPKTASTKKKGGKSSAAAAAKPKQPRSIKSAGAKRMKVVSAV